MVAIALGADALSVALGVGFGGANFRQTFRLTFHFGLFQAFMPLLGWLLGQHAIALASRYDHWIAFGLLCGIGGKMLYEALVDDERGQTPIRKDRTRGWSLVMLSFAASVDAFGAGIGMGVTDTHLLIPCLTIGVVASTMTFTGLRLGEKLSSAFGRRVEILGGLILIVMGFKMLAI